MTGTTPGQRLLRIGAIYHAVLGGVAALVPQDLLGFLGMERPAHWGFYYLAVLAPVVAGGLLELAHRREALRAGVLSSVIAGNLAALAILSFFVVWSELPLVVLGPAGAAGLWAWLLWGLIPEEEL